MGPIGNSSPNRGTSQHQIPIAVEFAESPIAFVCSGCKSMNKVGMHISIADKSILICVKCLASMVYRYHKIHPEENLIDLDVRVEGPELLGKVASVLDRELAGYGISSKDRDRCADEILLVFDEDKW